MNLLLRKGRSALIRARHFFRSQRFGVDPASIYGETFYSDGGFAKTEYSAGVIVDWVSRNLAPASVLDLGSGSGFYLRALASRGIYAVGLEASPAGVAASGEDVLALAYDLRRPVHLSRRFDLAMCVEVAEHLPKRYSRTLVESLSANAEKFVLFTAAPPGTPGCDHINCQSEAYWAALFLESGFRVRSDLTANLRAAAQEADTADWWKSWSWCFERTGQNRDGGLSIPPSQLGSQ